MGNFEGVVIGQNPYAMGSVVQLGLHRFSYSYI